MAPNTSSRAEAAARCLRSAAKYALIGALALGTVAFVHVVWDAYKFEAAGGVSHHPFMPVALIITLIGVVVGGALGAVVGVGVGLAKGRK